MNFKNYFNKQLYVIILFNIVVAAMYNYTVALVPVYIQKIIDLDSIGTEVFRVLIIEFLIVKLSGELVGFLDMYSSWKFDAKYNEYNKMKCISKLLKMKRSAYYQKEPMEYVSIIENDLSGTHDYFEQFFLLIKYIIGTLIYIGIMGIFIPFRYVLICVLSMSIFAYILNKNATKIEDEYSEVLDKLGEYLQYVESFFKNTVIFNRDTYVGLVRRHDEKHKEYIDAKETYDLHSVRLETLNKTFSYLVQLGSLIIFTVLIVSKNLSIGAAIASYQLMSYVFEMCEMILETYISLKAMKGSFEEIDAIYESEEMETPVNDSRNISIDNLSVGYDIPLVEDINVELIRNKKYLLKGENGSGKSTLINTLRGIIQPLNGSVSENLDLYYLNSNPVILKGTLKDNITMFGTYQLDINELPKFIVERLATLNDNSEECSQGEQQLICIIRAIAAHKSLLILDEAMSAIDEEFMNKLLEYLSKLNTTIILVSHHVDACDNFETLEITNNRLVVSAL